MGFSEENYIDYFQLQRPSPKNSFSKKPLTLISDVGLLNVEIGLRHVKELPKTSAAMEKIVKQEIKNDNSSEGEYSSSVKELLHGLDSFIKEHYKSNKIEAEYFVLENIQEAILYLFWPIRHVLTHSAGIIDKKCKQDYEKRYNNLKAYPFQLDFPEILSEGEQFTATQKEYTHLKQCFFDYLKTRVSHYNYHTLVRLASIEYKLSGGKLEVLMWLNKDLGWAIDMGKAIEVGFDIDYAIKNKRIPNQNIKFSCAEERLLIDDVKILPISVLLRKNFEPLYP